MVLDVELIRLNSAIAASSDAESSGHFDAAEYFIGHGLVAIQRYLTAARSGLGFGMVDALDVPPMLRDGLSFVAAINAGANYWKHMEEWVEVINRSDGSVLKGAALRTLQQIESFTPWEDYTCSNLLAVLLEGQPLELSRLLPCIEQWRANLFGIRRS